MKIEKGNYDKNNWDDNVNALIYELNLINIIYNYYFNNFDVSNLTVSFDTTVNSDAPICFKISSRIVLNADICYWSQIAYQYCHELCHYCISDGIPQKFKWFEESICELSSIYFMNILAEVWGENNFYPNYANHFKEYANNVLADNNCEEFYISDLSHDSAILQLMSNNQYLRKYNRTIAKRLLNYFQNIPQLWSQTPKLALIKDIQSFESFLIEWSNIADPSFKNVILSILNDFKKDSKSSLAKVP